jgi:hypothetical protein
LSPENGFVIIDNVKDCWGCGAGKGSSSIIKIQLGLRGSIFAGHGYPCDQEKYDIEKGKHDTIHINYNDWSATGLTEENKAKRNMND